MIERRAITIVEPGSVEVLREPLDPVPPPGHLLVRTRRSVVSIGTEGIVYAGDFSPGTHWHEWIKYPIKPGYMNCGVVEAVGEGVVDFRVGDRVATGGAHVSHFVWPAHRAAHVPEIVADEEAAWTHVGLITQVGARASQQALGDSVVIVGAGVLGQLVVQYARLMGARDVIVIDPSEVRLELARRHGATLTLATGVEDARKAVREVTNGRFADVAYDITGNHRVLAPTLGLLRRYGKMVLLGDTGHTSRQHVAPELIVSGLSIVGAHASHIPERASEFQPWDVRRCYDLFLSYLARGAMDVTGLITHRFEPDDAADVYKRLSGPERAATLGVVFTWS